MSEAEMTKLEDAFPALAVAASRAAFAEALTVGSVLVVEGEALVEVFADGRRVVVQPMPPRRKVRPGTVVRATS